MQALGRSAYRLCLTRLSRTPSLLSSATWSSSSCSHRTFLFPDSEDVLMLGLSHAKSVTEVFDLLEQHEPNVDVSHCSQALASLFFLSKLHAMPQTEVSVDHVEALASHRAEIDRLAMLLYDQMDTLPVVAKSYVFLCLRRLGWQLSSRVLRKMHVQLIDDLSKAKSLVADSYFASALKPSSQVRFSLFSTRLVRHLCLSSMLPRLRIYLSEAKSAEDLGRIAICLNQVSLMATPTLMNSFQQRVTEYLDQRGSFSANVTNGNLSAKCYIAKALYLCNDVDQSKTLRLRLYKMLSGHVHKLTCEKLKNLARVVKSIGDQKFEDEVRQVTLGWVQRLKKRNKKVLITKCLLLTSYLRTWGAHGDSEGGLGPEEAQRLLMDVTADVLKLDNHDCIDISTYVLELWRAAPNGVHGHLLGKFLNRLSEVVSGCGAEEKAYYFFDLVVNYCDIIKKYAECPSLESSLVSEMERLDYQHSPVPSHFFVYLGLKILTGTHIDRDIIHRCRSLMPRAMDHSQCFLLVLCMEAHSASLLRHRGSSAHFRPEVRSIFKRLLEWSVTSCRQGRGEAAELNLLLTLLNWQRVLQFLNNSQSTCVPWSSEARLAMRRLASKSMSLEVHTVVSLCSNLLTLPSSFIEPALLDTLIAFCVWNRVRVQPKTLLALLHLCFRVDHSLKKDNNFLRICSSCIQQRLEYISPTEILQAAIALMHYEYLSNELCSKIFCTEFMQRLDAMCARRPSVLGELRFLLGTLNRSVCLRQPESNVPWRHDSFFVTTQNHIRKRTLERLFRDDVANHLNEIVGSPQLIKSSCMSPMRHTMDFEIHLDARGHPIVGHGDSDSKIENDNTSRKVAVLLIMDGDNLGSLMPQIFDPGWVSSKIKDLEAEEYKVVALKMSEWLTSCGKLICDNPDHQNRLRDSLKKAQVRDICNQ